MVVQNGQDGVLTMSFDKLSEAETNAANAVIDAAGKFTVPSVRISDPIYDRVQFGPQLATAAPNEANVLILAFQGDDSNSYSAASHLMLAIKEQIPDHRAQLGIFKKPDGPERGKFSSYTVTINLDALAAHGIDAERLAASCNQHNEQLNTSIASRASYGPNSHSQDTFWR